MSFEFLPAYQAVGMLTSMSQTGRKLDMPGEPHYQPNALKPYLGYDNRVGWQIIAEWYWMVGLARKGIMPPEHAVLLTPELLGRLLRIKTTTVTKVERRVTKHDILALLREMRKVLPKELHRWLHLGCTSYDIICTAYALQIVYTWIEVMLPKAHEVHRSWKFHIGRWAETLQGGRTHLQNALPLTAGCWLACLYGRFWGSVGKAEDLLPEIPGKFSGAVGTSAAIHALFGDVRLEDEVLGLLGLPSALSTQITPPEPVARFYHELTLMSGALANLGDDIRHLQMPGIAEVLTDSSTSSSMSHKEANPVAAENIDGMHISVRCEEAKVTQTLNSTLQRVLTNSSVMRAYSAIFVFVYQQLLTAERIFKTLRVDEERCRTNFEAHGNLVVAELLHLSLQMQGFPDAHTFVNKKIVPKARVSGRDLCTEMDAFARRSQSATLKEAWAAVPHPTKIRLGNPALYIGNAVEIARTQAR